MKRLQENDVTKIFSVRKLRLVTEKNVGDFEGKKKEHDFKLFAVIEN